MPGRRRGTKLPAMTSVGDLGKAQGRAAPLWIAACSLAIVTALAMLALQPPVNADVTWHLVMGRAAEAGARYYQDVRDPNLPPIYWFAQAADRLGTWTGYPAHGWYFLAAALWLGGALLVLRPLLAELLPPARAWLLLAGFAWIFAGVPGLHAGQRDHLAAIGLLPYLVAAALPQRSSGARRVVIALGVAAAVVLKPYYVGVPALVELWRLRGGLHGLRRSEALLAAPMTLLIVGTCLAVEPGYLDYLDRFGSLYALLPPAALSWDAWALIALLPATALLALAQRCALSSALLLGGCGALAVTALQNKWWDYHVLAPMLLLMAGLLAQVLQPLRKTLAIALAVLALPVLAWGALQSWRNLSVYQLHDSKAPFLAEVEGWIVAAGGSSARVAILSGHVVDFMPAVYSSGAGWALADPSLWQLAAYPRMEPPQPAVQQAFLDEIVQRLASDPPQILGLQALGQAGEPGSLFLALPDFQALLSRYEPLGVQRQTRYWRLRAP